MNILITRPLIDAEDLMGKLFSLGHKIIHIPTLKIRPVKIKPIDEKKSMRTPRMYIKKDDAVTTLEDIRI